MNHELAETSCTNQPDQCLDYFQLIYECVHTRNHCLNFLDFTLHTLTGDDVIFSILQSLFKGNPIHSFPPPPQSLSLPIVTSNVNPSERSLSIKLEQLNLAYQWRQIDIVTKSIIVYERDWQVNMIHSINKQSIERLIF